MQPYHTVNDEGFRHMLKVLEPHYSPLEKRLLILTFQSCMRESQNTSSECGMFFYYHRYADFLSKAVIQCLNLNSDFEPCCHMLDTKEFQEEHTGIQIAAELRDILES